MILKSADRFYFLIVGCQRSGTTLMRLILDSHSSIQCHDESLAYNVFRGSAELICQRPLIGFKVPQVTEQLAWPLLRHDNFYQQGGGRDLEVRNPYIGQKIIFMIRDARDVVASMVTLPHWFERYGNPVLEARIAGDSKFKDRYSTEISFCEASRFPKIARAALIWRYKMDALFGYLRRGYPLLPLWYEALVASPRTELLRVCAFLQIPWEEAILRHPSSPRFELGLDGRAMGRTDPGRSIDAMSVGRWRSQFTSEQLREIIVVAGPALFPLYPNAVLRQSSIRT